MTITMKAGFSAVKTRFSQTTTGGVMRDIAKNLLTGKTAFTGKAINLNPTANEIAALESYERQTGTTLRRANVVDLGLTWAGGLTALTIMSPFALGEAIVGEKAKG